MPSSVFLRLKPEATKSVTAGVASGFSRTKLLCLIGGLTLLLCPVTASAQIYAWRDATGNLVLSDKAKDPSARSYSLSPAIDTTVRTTKPLSKRATQYQDLIEEHAALNTVSVNL